MDIASLVCNESQDPRMSLPSVFAGDHPPNHNVFRPPSHPHPHPHPHHSQKHPQQLPVRASSSSSLAQASLRKGPAALGALQHLDTSQLAIPPFARQPWPSTTHYPSPSPDRCYDDPALMAAAAAVVYRQQQQQYLPVPTHCLPSWGGMPRENPLAKVHYDRQFHVARAADHHSSSSNTRAPPQPAPSSQRSIVQQRSPLRRDAPPTAAVEPQDNDSHREASMVLAMLHRAPTHTQQEQRSNHSQDSHRMGKSSSSSDPRKHMREFGATPSFSAHPIVRTSSFSSTISSLSERDVARPAPIHRRHSTSSVDDQSTSDEDSRTITSLSSEPETSYPPSPNEESSDRSFSSARSRSSRTSAAPRRTRDINGSSETVRRHKKKERSVSPHLLDYELHHDGRHPYYSDRSDDSEDGRRKDATFRQVLARAADQYHRCGKITCPCCRKDFTRLCNFRSHFRIHQVTRPFNCHVCDQQFLRKHDLNRHERIHAGVKPFRCGRCGKGFVRKDALRRHENMVPDIQKFRCVVENR